VTLNGTNRYTTKLALALIAQVYPEDFPSF